MMIARKVRAYVEIPISLTDLRHSIRYALTISNISLSGCFIKMDQGLKAGTPIACSLPLREGRSLDIRGTVVRDQSDPHGYGIMFEALPDEDKKELALLIADSLELPSAD